MVQWPAGRLGIRDKKIRDKISRDERGKNGVEDGPADFMPESDNGDIREEVPVFEPVDMSQKWGTRRRTCVGSLHYGQWFGKAAQPKVDPTDDQRSRETCSRRVCDAPEVVLPRLGSARLADQAKPKISQPQPAA
ncbi:hypothetical protein B0H17DRAFT_1123575 [Mycena rosella]|uniref:Uncharacterized protein n=1 Tax=Mycena rosella TaxID=1033263 RepID=A0AAD7H1Z8_MYCRO|nr:hypothetical protein B0H17DRAFT_1123575 [Mycena rosella]